MERMDWDALADIVRSMAEDNKMTNIDCYGYVPGAHDWFTWSQLFHIFITEYLWK
jgi:hypothetical protein